MQRSALIVAFFFLFPFLIVAHQIHKPVGPAAHPSVPHPCSSSSFFFVCFSKWILVLAVHGHADLCSRLVGARVVCHGHRRSNNREPNNAVTHLPCQHPTSTLVNAGKYLRNTQNAASQTCTHTHTHTHTCMHACTHLQRTMNPFTLPVRHGCLSPGCFRCARCVTILKRLWKVSIRVAHTLHASPPSTSLVHKPMVSPINLFIATATPTQPSHAQGLAMLNTVVVRLS